MQKTGLKKGVAHCLGALVLALGIAGSAGANNSGGPAGVLPLEPLVINLKNEHYIQMTPLLKLFRPEEHEAVKAWVPLLRHELIKYMMGREHFEVASPEFMRAFSREVTELFNSSLPDDYIRDVIFDSWVVQ